MYFLSCPLYTRNNKYIGMVKKSKIDIFNVMTEEELENELKNADNSRREYQRIVAMSCIANGISHKTTAIIVGVSYRTINRWAHACSEGGIENLRPEFNGGRPPQLTNYQKLFFANHLYLNQGLSMTEAKEYLNKRFYLDFSLTHVINIVESLGFNYRSHRPEFIEAPENKEELLINSIEEAEITEDDIVVGVDESTMKTGNKTKKGIYFDDGNSQKKREKITKETISCNYIAILGYNVDSLLIPANNLTEFEFVKALLKMREAYDDNDYTSFIFHEIIENYDLTKKEIRTIIELKNESNTKFINKIERSIKANKNDSKESLAIKLDKHCKRESTENPNKQKEIRKEYIINLLISKQIDEFCENMPRIVVFLDNALAHKTDFVKKVAKFLNIYLLHIPKYSPDLAPVETVFLIIKNNLKSNTLTTKEEVDNKCNNVFDEKCDGDKLSGWFVERYLPIIC